MKSNNNLADSAPPPQDSDTDSGICADSDQSSPRHPVASSHFPHYNHPQHVYRQQLAEDRDYLTPNCASEVSVLSPRRLPPRPSTVAGQIRTGKQQFRVRFADEVNSGASTSSSSSEQSNTSPRQPEPILNYSDINAPRVSSSRRLPHASYSIEDVESLPEPPSYAIAVQRLRASDMPRESIRDTVIRQNVQDAFNRQFRNRSSSLPRGTRRESSELSSATDRLIYDYQMNRLFPDEILGSLDNLNIHSACGVPLDDMTFKRRKLPVAPLMGSATNIPDAVDVQSECGRQPALMRQR
uniref:Uncharacterized protein n=1 Tax=Heterorhabditis bacteriophora TaxID=37862 RepID=A0A1I7XGL4_HETBA